MGKNNVIKTYSLDQEIAEKFSEQTPAQETSKELEKLMAEYIDEDLEVNLDPIELLDKNVVSDKRCKLVEKIVENNYWNRTGPQIFKKLKAEGMYQGDSGSYHFKEALRFLEKYDGSHITRLQGKIVAEQFKCLSDGCDVEMNLKALDKNDMECPKCERSYTV